MADYELAGGAAPMNANGLARVPWAATNRPFERLEAKALEQLAFCKLLGGAYVRARRYGVGDARALGGALYAECHLLMDRIEPIDMKLHVVAFDESNSLSDTSDNGDNLDLLGLFMDVTEEPKRKALYKFYKAMTEE